MAVGMPPRPIWLVRLIRIHRIVARRRTGQRFGGCEPQVTRRIDTTNITGAWKLVRFRRWTSHVRRSGYECHLKDWIKAMIWITSIIS